MKSKKGLKTALPAQHELDVVVPALIILLALWFLAKSPLEPSQNEPEPNNQASISEEMAVNASSPAENAGWFAQTIKSRKETN